MSPMLTCDVPSAMLALVIGVVVASTSARTPSRSSACTPDGWIPCVDNVSLGNSARSKRQTCSPARAKFTASEAPAQRAPTIATSNRSGIGAPFVEHCYNLVSEQLSMGVCCDGRHRTANAAQPGVVAVGALHG